MDENTLNMLERLASLKENGTITEQEFNEQKQKILKTKKEEEEIEPTAPASKTTNKTGGFFKRIGAYIVVIFLGVPMCIAIISPSTHNTPTKSQRRPIKQINKKEKTGKKVTKENLEQIVKEATKKALQKKANNEEWDAVTICQEAVKASSKFPTKTDFSWDVKKKRTETNTIEVGGRVELMNSFGAEIPHVYWCKIKKGKLVDILVDKG